MLLIESDKRGEEYALPLAYSRPDEQLFSVPPNLYILGLMNTADRSLAMVDYALRRRFAFHKLEPQFSSQKFQAHLQRYAIDSRLIDVIVTRMTSLNSEISEDKLRLGPGYQIGHSFFTPGKGVVPPLDSSWYRRVIRTEIVPLLEEYWFDNSEKAEIWAARLLEAIG